MRLLTVFHSQINGQTADKLRVGIVFKVLHRV